MWGNQLVYYAWCVHTWKIIKYSNCVAHCFNPGPTHAFTHCQWCWGRGFPSSNRCLQQPHGSAPWFKPNSNVVVLRGVAQGCRGECEFVSGCGSCRFAGHLQGPITVACSRPPSPIGIQTLKWFFHAFILNNLLCGIRNNSCLSSCVSLLLSPLCASMWATLTALHGHTHYFLHGTGISFVFPYFATCNFWRV